jgi:SET domain-containing protein
MPKKTKLGLKNTSPHGRGVFVSSWIEKGILLLEYKGKRRRWSEFANGVDTDYVCLMHSDDEFVIDPRINGNIARFINHSCEPNCATIFFGKRVYIKTLRKIEAGEEITYDYQLEVATKKLTRKDLLRFPCSCGTSKCRGTLLNYPSRMVKKRFCRKNGF